MLKVSSSPDHSQLEWMYLDLHCCGGLTAAAGATCLIGGGFSWRWALRQTAWWLSIVCIMIFQKTCSSQTCHVDTDRHAMLLPWLLLKGQPMG